MVARETARQRCARQHARECTPERSRPGRGSPAPQTVSFVTPHHPPRRRHVSPLGAYLCEVGDGKALVLVLLDEVGGVAARHRLAREAHLERRGVAGGGGQARLADEDEGGRLDGREGARRRLAHQLRQPPLLQPQRPHLLGLSKGAAHAACAAVAERPQRLRARRPRARVTGPTRGRG